MSGRDQAVMRTRCPVCGTVFRVTSEQIRQKAGKVRCGRCRGVFNAFDQLLTDEPPIEAQALPARGEPPPSAGETTGANAVASAERPMTSPAVTTDVTAQAWVPARFAARRSSTAAAETPQPSKIVDPPPAVTPSADLPAKEDKGKAAAANWPETAILITESPEQSTQAARTAGLAAAREWSETPSYNRWAADPLTGEVADFAAEAGRRALWPFVIVALPLALILAAQLLHHFRTEVVRRLPTTAAYYELAGIAVPLPRQGELVVIESSDLQFDQLRDQFVLQATLRNRAFYAQDWPALELTLTDAGDTIVARRVITAIEYLPPAISPERFPANGEVAVRLWIEARDLGAAGYRLYVFYP